VVKYRKLGLETDRKCMEMSTKFHLIDRVANCYTVSFIFRFSDKKVTPKRRRSLLVSDEPSSFTPPPPSAGHTGSSVKSGKSTPGGPGGGGGCGGTPRLHTVPLSERQQLQMLMQMTADELHPGNGRSRDVFGFQELVFRRRTVGIMDSQMEGTK